MIKFTLLMFQNHHRMAIFLGISLNIIICFILQNTVIHSLALGVREIDFDIILDLLIS